MIPNLSVLIAAAGRGSRSGLPYPKTLYSIRGKSILIRQLEIFAKYDECPTIVVSPDGSEEIRKEIERLDKQAHLVFQDSPKGMGDAVLRFILSPAYEDTEHVILSWGDIPFIQKSTLDTLISTHFKNENDFTFPTKFVDEAYTIVFRDSKGNIKKIAETRNSELDIMPGERDMGLFIFKKDLVINQLKMESDIKYSSKNNEHGFLYVVQELIGKKSKVEALDIATDLDLISLNKISDLSSFDP